MAELVTDASTLQTITPMMQQYLDIKAEHPNEILMYRLGDFYEMFFADAVLVSRELELTLTGRDCGGERRAAMCGVPFHKVDFYIGKLIERGYRVAVCDQMEDPSTAKGLVRRDIARIVTPGTVTDGTLLTETKNNYLASLCFDGDDVGLAFADISTGQISVTVLTGDGVDGRLENELGIFTPTEAIMNLPRADCRRAADFLTHRFATVLTDDRPDLFDEFSARQAVTSRFADAAAGITNPAMMRATGALLSYIVETQKCGSLFIRDLQIYNDTQSMEIDISTRRNLELVESMRSKEKKGSLLWVLDKTQTSMGARMLRAWILKPLVHPAPILERQGAVSDFVSDFMARQELRVLLSPVLDLERLTAKAVYNTANAKDLCGILQGLVVLPELYERLAPFTSPRLAALREDADTLSDITDLLMSAMPDNPPVSLRDGGLIRDGYHKDVDYLRAILSNGRGWIDEIESREREATGIKTLRVGYNKVFGYYIEVSKSQISMVPERYIRKQTLTNGERYITEELKEMESTVLGAAEKLTALEYSLFCSVREQVAAAAARIKAAAARIAEVDVYLSLAEVAAKNRYVCPEVDMSEVFEVKDGRHPVVEKFVNDSYFVPNDTKMDTAQNRLLLITGPNMAGKSTYMRQVALMAVMAQIGSFVPAKEARIGIVDRLFTRVGASDDLASGQSTFMLEMNEVAHILKNATRRSLIVYDEVGRGTSTYDGMSIARAVVEYTLGKKIGARTLFATHYHELTAMEGEFEGIVNYHIAAKKRGDDIHFLRKIVRGATDDSYGIEVAKLAGVPAEVVRRARAVLEQIEGGAPAPHRTTPAPAQSEELPDMLTSLIAEEEKAVSDRVRAADLNTMTPIEAMNLIFELKKMLSTEK